MLCIPVIRHGARVQMLPSERTADQARRNRHRQRFRGRDPEPPSAAPQTGPNARHGTVIEVIEDLGVVACGQLRNLSASEVRLGAAPRTEDRRPDSLFPNSECG